MSCFTYLAFLVSVSLWSKQVAGSGIFVCGKQCGGKRMESGVEWSTSGWKASQPGYYTTVLQGKRECAAAAVHRNF